MESHRPILIAFDVGATNTRAVAAVLGAHGVTPHPLLGDGMREQISSRKELYDFVWRVLDSLPDGDHVAGAAFAAAGPVDDHSSLAMTNWMDTRPILLEELEDLGLPRNATTLMNDLEAGALGLLHTLETEGLGSDAFETLHEGRNRAGHYAFAAPGTGLGAAGIIGVRGAPRRLEVVGDEPQIAARVVVPCEVQHTRLPAIDAEVARVADRIAKESRREWVSWEDVVSGRGLLDSYVALCSLTGLVPIVAAMPEAGEEESAYVASIARAAIEGDDGVCTEAVDLYYRCLGAFCQALALTFLPCAGVFVGGDTTRKNRDFLVRSSFLRTLQHNPVHEALMRDVPVHLVLRETNLAGGLRRAEEMARRAMPLQV